MAEIQAGTYRAKILDYGVKQTENLNPQAVILFGFKDQDGNERKYSWFGSFTAKSTKWTIRALLVCGLSRELDALAEGPAGRALNQEAEVDIVIQHETYQGKKQIRISFINPPGSSSGIKDRVDLATAKTLLGGADLRAELLAARQELQAEGKLPAPHRKVPDELPEPGSDFDPNFADDMELG